MIEVNLSHVLSRGRPVVCLSPAISTFLHVGGPVIEQNDPKSTRKIVRAAQYVRMSTEHQQYSTENQAEVIARYAAEHGMEIVATYADSGKSGLTLGGRAELQRLLAEAQSGHADFSVVLVYDVSRWGRFLDADESAYHEYVCRKAGINVHYPAEQCVNDGSPISTLVKAVKRTMAAEYSRELSVKVFAGQCRLIELDYRQGGMAGYGLRRQLIAMDGTAKGLLSRGEQKSFQTDRVVLVPGPDDELSIVREIFDAFTSMELTESQIAQLITDQQFPGGHSAARPIERQGRPMSDESRAVLSP